MSNKDMKNDITIRERQIKTKMRCHSLQLEWLTKTVNSGKDVAEKEQFYAAGGTTY